MLIQKQFNKLILQQTLLEQEIGDFISFLKQTKETVFEFSQGTVKVL